MSDIVLLMQYLSDPKKCVLSEQGKKNADCVDAGNGLNKSDALALQMVVTRKLSKTAFPITSSKLKSLQ